MNKQQKIIKCKTKDFVTNGRKDIQNICDIYVDEDFFKEFKIIRKYKQEGNKIILKIFIKRKNEK